MTVDFYPRSRRWCVRHHGLSNGGVENGGVENGGVENGGYYLKTKEMESGVR